MSESSPIPNKLLERSTAKGGKLKIYLGYAAGVGKTYQMLVDAQHLRASGIDVVIGYFEPHGRKDTIAKTEGLEIIPRRTFEYRGTLFEEMDTAAILRRHPAVCAVDEFAHTNVPGAERPKRWEDVRLMLDAGIDVLTTVNVQHLESLNDQIWQVTGVRVRETLPDWVLQEADEIVMVDVTPRALLHRLERGAVYAQDKAQRALENFFTESNLTALRELAMRQTAYQLEDRREESSSLQADSLKAAPGNRRSEKILIHVTADPSTAMLIRRGKRVADYLQAECLALYVARNPTGKDISPAEKQAIERHLGFARSLHIDVQTLEGADVAKTLADFARAQHVTQIFAARACRDTNRIIHLSREMEVTVVAERRR